VRFPMTVILRLISVVFRSEDFSISARILSPIKRLYSNVLSYKHFCSMPPLIVGIILKNTKNQERHGMHRGCRVRKGHSKQGTLFFLRGSIKICSPFVLDFALVWGHQ
jgi:hypothetical protein